MEKQIELEKLTLAELWKLAHEQLQQLQIYQNNHTIILAEIARRENEYTEGNKKNKTNP